MIKKQGVILEKLNNFLNMQEHKLKSSTLKDYNSLVFAYLGDSIHTLFIRTHLVLEKNEKVGALHKKTSEFVKASRQAQSLDNIITMLTEDELRIVKTARNTHQKTVAKNASIEDYKKATSFEALIGYLYLSGNIDRMNEILNESIKGL